MTTWMWALFAAIAAVGAEGIFRAYPHLPYWRLVGVSLPLAIAVNYGIYKLMIQADHFLSAVVLFSTSTALLRVLYSTALGEAPHLATWAAFGMILAARFVEVWGKP